MGPSTWEEALDTVLAEMRAVMIARQRKYSRRNIEEQGLYGVLTRATADKLSRVMTSLNGRVVHGRVELDDIRDAQDETFEDGLIDAAVNGAGAAVEARPAAMAGMPRACLRLGTPTECSTRRRRARTRSSRSRAARAASAPVSGAQVRPP